MTILPWIRRCIPLIFILGIFLFGYFRLLETNTIDERMLLSDVDTNYALLVLLKIDQHRGLLSPKEITGQPKVPFFFHVGYGGLYYGLSLLAWKLRVLAFGANTATDAYLAMRWLCFLSALCSLGLYFRLGPRLKLPHWFPYLAIFVTATSHEFYSYSLTPKPDTLQFFFVLLSLIFLLLYLERDKKNYFIFAAICAGLATAAKLGGIFLIPSLIAAFCFKNITTNAAMPGPKQVIKTITQGTALTLSVLGSTYLLFNYRWLIDYRFYLESFMQGVYHQNWQNAGIKWSVEWFWKPINFGYGLALGYSIYLIHIIFLFFKNGWRDTENAALCIINLFPLSLLIFVSFTIHDFSSTLYLLPILPVMLINAAKSLQWLIKMILEKTSLIRPPFLLAISLWAFMLADLNRYQVAWAYLDEDLHYLQSLRSSVGFYLLKHYPQDTKIVYYVKAWIPDFFQNVISFNWSVPKKIHILSWQPDVIVLLKIPGDDDGRQEHNRLLKELEEHALPYKKVLDWADQQSMGTHYLVFERDDLRK